MISNSDPLINYQNRINIRFRLFRTAGRWIDHFPLEHQVLDSDLIVFKSTIEGSDLISYWEKLFYEHPEEVADMTTQFDELQIDL